MAYSYSEATGDGVATVFPFAFSGVGSGYIRRQDIVVTVNGVATTDFIFSGTNQIQFTTAPPAPVAPWVGPNIKISRVMPKDAPYADFTRGNNFGQDQMNSTVLQQLYVMHELLDSEAARDAVVAGVKSDMAEVSAAMASGTYTPVATAGGQATNVIADKAQWIRVGNIVTVSGFVRADSNTGSIASFQLSLPIPSNFDNAYDCTGTAVALTGDMTSAIVSMYNDNARFQWMRGNTSGTFQFFYTYMYEVK